MHKLFNLSRLQINILKAKTNFQRNIKYQKNQQTKENLFPKNNKNIIRLKRLNRRLLIHK